MSKLFSKWNIYLEKHYNIEKYLFKNNFNDEDIFGTG